MKDKNHNLPDQPGETNSLHYQPLKQSRVPVWIMAIFIAALVAVAIVVFKLIRG
jgi:hypothetical protein